MACYLTRRALRDLAAIHAYSVETFGEPVADRYLSDIYAVFALLEAKPSLGDHRKRAAPFAMYPAREHFIIYEIRDGEVYVLTLLAQVGNIEAILIEIGRALKNEVRILRGRS